MHVWVEPVDPPVIPRQPGGLLSNYPIDSPDRLDGKPPGWPTFGVTLLPNLPQGNDKVISRDISRAEIDALYAEGYDAASRFLSTRDEAAYVRRFGD